MRQERDGRSDLPFRSYAPRGNTIFNTRDAERGTILSVDPTAQTVTVQWASGDFPVVYPSDAEVLRRTPYPWE